MQRLFSLVVHGDVLLDHWEGQKLGLGTSQQSNKRNVLLSIWNIKSFNGRLSWNLVSCDGPISPSSSDSVMRLRFRWEVLFPVDWEFPVGTTSLGTSPLGTSFCALLRSG